MLHVKIAKDSALFARDIKLISSLMTQCSGMNIEMDVGFSRKF